MPLPPVRPKHRRRRSDSLPVSADNAPAGLRSEAFAEDLLEPAANPATAAPRRAARPRPRLELVLAWVRRTR